uniref:Uncharacterized protein n=1 Tax=Equus asinus asinus TaxID=83772 RepID=A0A8C4LFG3_EQUAS
MLRGWGPGAARSRATDYLLKFLLAGDSDVGKGKILQDGAAESPYAYILLGQGPTLLNLCNLIYLFKGPISKYSYNGD